jgi:hypothetical protein
MDIADTTKNDVDDFESGGGMRTSVDSLLVAHKAAIEELREAVADCLPEDSEFYDDIFLLRFVLTWEKKGGLTESSDAVRKTVAWRTENAEALAQTVRTGIAPGEEVMKRFNTAGYAGSLAGMEPLFIVRTGYCNLKGLMNACTMEEVARLATISKEVAFAECDKKTRKTRQLVKMISIIDLEGFSMFGGDSRFHKALGESSKQAAVYYPQLLGKTVLISKPLCCLTASGFAQNSNGDAQTCCACCCVRVRRSPIILKGDFLCLLGVHAQIGPGEDRSMPRHWHLAARCTCT